MYKVTPSMVQQATNYATQRMMDNPGHFWADAASHLNAQLGAQYAEERRNQTFILSTILAVLMAVLAIAFTASGMYGSALGAALAFAGLMIVAGSKA